VSLTTGLGWRQPHYAQLLARRPPLAFLEVHSENFFAEGGAALGLLQAARADYAISLHGVGLGLGSAAGLDAWHLDQLEALVERIDPLRVSDHACFARAGGLHAQDLLPLRFDDATLALLSRQVQQVQERLRRPLLVEHLSAYVHWDGDRLAEPEFFNALTAGSGCQLLLDVNNLYVNACNQGQADDAARDWMNAIRRGSVGEIHIAGHAELDGLRIDDHGSAVIEPVWALLAQARERFGADTPVLLERDTGIPPLDDLLAEVARAEQGA
jgi:uncharacterized protein